MKKKTRVGIIGAGTMGSGIAQVASTARCDVQLFDDHQDALTRSRANLEKVLSRLVEKGKIDDAQSKEVAANIHYDTNFNDLVDCDIVFEAIIEDAEIKEKFFCQMEEMVREDCVLATNTSSLSITSLAACLKRPERFIGAHFFNPAPLMKLVEIIPAVQTEAETTSRVRALIDGWGKRTVLAKDTPGFIVNKVARPFYGEALRILEEGIADPPTIDWAMTELGGFRMGPFQLMDFIGNDVNYAVTESVFKAF
ncbi:MAG: 3-hydroxyacyl-CoA dehydrogenase NAD-binding domain-containing protein, partial [Bacteroidota bacterium]